MVRLRGPILSLDASGTLADTLTCSKWKGRHYMKRHKSPSNPRSQSQVANRILLRWLNDQWSVLNDDQRDTWSGLAAAGEFAPFSAFIAENLKRWSRFRPPTKAWPAAEENLPGTISAAFPKLDGYIHGTTWNVDLSNLRDNWLYALFMSTETSFASAKDNLIDIRVLEHTDLVFFDITPLEPGTYYFRGRRASDDGVWSIQSARKTEVVFDY